MICVIALIVFGFLGIFSAKYRVIAKEAAECVFRRLTLRKCETGLDKRLKNQIVGKLAPKFPKLGKFLFKYFEVFSWLMIALLVASLVFIGIGVDNYIRFGNCNGPQNSQAFCILDPSGVNSQYSGIAADFNKPIIYPAAGNDPSIGPNDSKVTFIEFACLTCTFSKKAEPIMYNLVHKYENQSVRFVFKLFPLPTHNNSIDSAKAAICAYEQGKYFQARREIFDRPSNLRDRSYFVSVAKDVGMDEGLFNSCMDDPATDDAVRKHIQEGADAHVYGTPTYFINNRTITGLVDEQRLVDIINEELVK